MSGGFDPVEIGFTDDHGTIDLARLATLLDEGDVAFVCLELDTNSVGGHPVTPKQLAKAQRLADDHDVLLVLDATRVVDNVLATTDDDADAAVWDAVREALGAGDVVMLSLTKNFGITTGGLLATNDDELAATITSENRSRVHDLSLTARKHAAAALADTAGVAELARGRRAAVRALWQPLHAAGLPVLDAPGHCVVLDTAQLPDCDGFDHPQLATLSWIFARTGVRGAPQLSDADAMRGAVRFAVPFGTDASLAADAGRAIVAALYALGRTGRPRRRPGRFGRRDRRVPPDRCRARGRRGRARGAERRSGRRQPRGADRALPGRRAPRRRRGRRQGRDLRRRGQARRCCCSRRSTSAPECSPSSSPVSPTGSGSSRCTTPGSGRARASTI